MWLFWPFPKVCVNKYFKYNVTHLNESKMIPMTDNVSHVKKKKQKQNNYPQNNDCTDKNVS